MPSNRANVRQRDCAQGCARRVGPCGAALARLSAFSHAAAHALIALEAVVAVSVIGIIAGVVLMA